MKYNTMLDVAFSVNHNFDEDYNLIETKEGMQMVLDALKRRLEWLMSNRDECWEAFGICDTYDNEDNASKIRSIILFGEGRATINSV